MTAAAMGRGEGLHIHLDLVGGIAGDMFVAAMVDALPWLAEPVRAELARVQPPGKGLPTFVEAVSAGLRVRRFRLRAPTGAGDAPPPPASVHDHPDASADHGTPLRVLRQLLEDAPLSPSTREHALALLALLGEAESRVHGIAVDAVHFHELADWDSLLDLVAAGCIAGELAGARWSASPLPLGGGRVRTAHGLLPVPAPATASLLLGYPWHDDGLAGERITPTGAAILSHLVGRECCGPCGAHGRLVASGHGAGTRELPGLPNIVRALVFDTRSAGSADHVCVIEFDIDDMSGEEIALAADRLRAHPDAIDVTVGSRLGKKGRPVHDFRVLGRAGAAEAIAAACFTETSTLGVRSRDESRRCLERNEVAMGDDPSNRVKIALRPNGLRSAKAAHDDVGAVPTLSERRRLRAQREREALGGNEE